MRAVDSKVVVRLIVRDDSRQTAVAEEFIRGGVMRFPQRENCFASGQRSLFPIA